MQLTCRLPQILLALLVLGILIFLVSPAAAGSATPSDNATVTITPVTTDTVQLNVTTVTTTVQTPVPTTPVQSNGTTVATTAPVATTVQPNDTTVATITPTQVVTDLVRPGATTTATVTPTPAATNPVQTPATTGTTPEPTPVPTTPVQSTITTAATTAPTPAVTTPVQPASTTIANISSVIMAQFRADAASGPGPLSVRFIDTSTGSPNRWRWDFGDGSHGAGRNTTIHTYQRPGTYSVTLTVKNPDGTSSTLRSGNITVTAQVNGTRFARASRPKLSDDLIGRSRNVTRGSGVHSGNFTVIRRVGNTSYYSRNITSGKVNGSRSL